METVASHTFLNSQRKPMDREQDRQQIESDVQAFLKKGGKITVLDIKASAATSKPMGNDNRFSSLSS